MADNEPDAADVRKDQRVTVEEARRRAVAAEGIVEPAASQEADEPTTAAADRVRLGHADDPNEPSPA